MDQTWSNLIRLDQTWSKWISQQLKNVTIKSCHIYKKDKNGCFILDFFRSDLSKMDQTWSNLIKLDFSQIKNVSLKSFHIYKNDKNACFILYFFWIRSVQNGSNLIKMSHQSKNVTVKSCHIYKKESNGCFVLDFFGSDLSKLELDQTWLNLSKLDQIGFLNNQKMLLLKG